MKNILVKLFLAFAAVSAVAGTIYYLTRRDAASEKHAFDPSDDDYFDPFGEDDSECSEENCDSCDASPICDAAATGSSDTKADDSASKEDSCDSCDKDPIVCSTCSSSPSNADTSDVAKVEEEVFFDSNKDN